jgi:hypothetical protein
MDWPSRSHPSTPEDGWYAANVVGDLDTGTAGRYEPTQRVSDGWRSRRMGYAVLTEGFTRATGAPERSAEMVNLVDG